MRTPQLLDRRPTHHLCSRNREAQTIDGHRRALLGLYLPSARRSTMGPEETSTPKVYGGESLLGINFIGFFLHRRNIELAEQPHGWRLHPEKIERVSFD